MTIPHAITLALAAIDHAREKHNWSIENPETSDGERFHILRDEVNEVALEAIRFIPAGSDRSNLRTELAQVAACALRWLAVEVGEVREENGALNETTIEQASEIEHLRKLLGEACDRLAFHAQAWRYEGASSTANETEGAVERLRREGGIES